MRYPDWQWRRSVESPWFYVVWFCLFGAVVLLVAEKKYGERQAGIERRFQARSQAAARQQDNGSATDPRNGAANYSTPEDTVIPLWPLGILLVVLGCLAACLAVRAGMHAER